VGPNEIVLKVAAALERANIPFMIVGSFASNVYGIERNTQDADLVVQLPAEGLTTFLEYLGSDFKLDPQLSFESIIAMGHYYVLRHLHPLFKIELFIVGDSEVARGEFQRRRKLIFQGTPLYFVSPEDLIVIKLRWFHADRRRTKDVDDVRGVLAVQQGKVDLGVIRERCDRYGVRDELEEIIRSLPALPRP